MKNKIFNRKNLSLVISVGSATWTYLKKFLIYGSRYAGNALAVGAIGVSAVAVGKSLDSDSQLKQLQQAVSSQNSELISTIEKANQANTGLSNVAESVTGSLNEITDKQNSLENKANDQENTIIQQSQSLNQINLKTTAALNDLTKVNKKIADANDTLNSLAEKSAKIVEDLTNASSDLISKNSDQDEKIKSINADILNLRTEVALNASDIETNKNLNSNENNSQNSTISAQTTEISNQSSLVSRFIDSLTSTIPVYDSHFASIDNILNNIYYSVHSGVKDDNSAMHGTITFPEMPSVPNVIANLNNSSGDGYVRIDSVTTNSFVYTIIGSPTYGFKISWLVTIF